MRSDSNRELLSTDGIAKYHEDVVDSLRFFLKQLYESKNKRFVGYTLSLFEQELNKRISETDLRSSLTILSAVEATLYSDFHLRVEHRRKDALSQSFRRLKRARRTRPRFDEDILELWKLHHPELGKLVGKLRAATHFRNWLAHGRYWERPENDRFDYSSLYDLALATLQSFPLYLPKQLIPKYGGIRLVPQTPDSPSKP